WPCGLIKSFTREGKLGRFSHRGRAKCAPWGIRRQSSGGNDRPLFGAKQTSSLSRPSVAPGQSLAWFDPSEDVPSLSAVPACRECGYICGTDLATRARSKAGSAIRGKICHPSGQASSLPSC